MMKKLVALLMALALLCSSIAAFAELPTNPSSESSHTGHTTKPVENQEYVKDNKPATCASDGYEWYICTTCQEAGEVLADYVFKKDIPFTADKTDPANHSGNVTPTGNTIAATCKNWGATEYHCDACEETWYRYDLAIDPENHADPVNFSNDKPTCDPDKTAYAHWKCNACTAPNWNVPLETKSHTPGDPVVTNPTETECGKEVISCTECNTELSSKTIAPTIFEKYNADPELYDYTNPVNLQNVYGASVAPHTIGFLKKGSENAATCEKAGSVTYFCVDCHKDFTIDLPKLAHTKDMLKDPVVIPGTRVEPTCTENGEVKYKGVCKTCKTEQIVTVILEANGAHESDGTKPVDTKPTCTEAGKLTYICKNCKKPYDVPYGTPNGHSWERNPQQPGQNYVEKATCTKDGKSSYAVVCADCGKIKPGSEDDTQVVVVPKLKHQTVLDKMVENKEIYTVDEKTGKVSIASTFTYKNGDVIKGAEVKNNQGDVVAVYGDCVVTYTPATCTEKGFVSIACKDCPAKIEKELTALGHNLNDAFEDPYGRPTWEDCTKPNSKLVKCTNPGCDYYENISVPAQPAHDFSVLIGYSQERTGGNIASYYCWDYDASYEDGLKAAFANIGTCSDYGEIMGCAHCMQEITVAKEGDGKHVIDEEDEEYPPIVKAPTCTEKGITSFRCTKCGFYKTKTKDALGHNWVSGKTIEEATCTKTGVREIYCNRCCHYETGNDGEKKLVANENCEIVKDTETIPTLAHDWQIHYKEPDCENDVEGFYYEQCSMCKEKRNEVVLTGHVYDENDVVWDPKPTCTTPGLASFKCTKCHERVQVEYPKLGHTYQRKGTDEYGLPVVWDIADVEKAHVADSTKCTKDCVARGCMTDATHTLTCDDCKQTLTWSEEGTAIGHHNMYTDSTKTKLNKFQILVAPNCTREGKAQYQCSVEGCNAVVEYTLPKLPHNLVADWDDEAGVYYFYCEELEKGKDDYKLYELIRETYPETRAIGEAIYNELRLKTPDGQNYGTFGTCGYEEEIAVKRTEYSISMRKDGLGQIALKDKDMLGLTAYVRITWRYELANGDTVGFKACLPVTVVEESSNEGCKIGTFKPSGLTAPYGSTLIDCFVEVVADADADLKPMGTYTTYGSDEL